MTQPKTHHSTPANSNRKEHHQSPRRPGTSASAVLATTQGKSQATSGNHPTWKELLGER